MIFLCLALTGLVVLLGLVFETNHAVMFVPFFLSATILIFAFIGASIRNKQLPVNFIWNIHKYVKIEFNDNEKKAIWISASLFLGSLLIFILRVSE